MTQPILLENPITKEQWVCDDLRQIKIIEGVEYLSVRKQDKDRTVLMRRDILKKIKR
ncbi:MAG: hypothetical protein RLZZ196_1575 [Bacteroidota bacterium]|jgi:hypothetical protein